MKFNFKPKSDTPSFSCPDPRNSGGALEALDPIATRVEFFDSSMPGRQQLDVVCSQRGQHWGLVRYALTSRRTTKAYILIGQMYEVEVEGGELDPCFSDLAVALEESGE
jgi:hypothetical protein